MTKEEFIEKTNETLLNLLRMYQESVDPKADSIYLNVCDGDRLRHYGIHAMYCEGDFPDYKTVDSMVYTLTENKGGATA